MKTLLLTTCLILSSCAATKPIRKPVGLGMLAVGGGLIDVTTAPVDKVEESEINSVAKIPLYIVTYPIAMVGGGLGFGFVVGSVIIYPEWMN